MANENPQKTPTEQPCGVHLVGGIPLANAEEVFRTTSSLQGERLRRIPDGETGVRTNWIGWQFTNFANNPNFEMVPKPVGSEKRRFSMRLKMLEQVLKGRLEPDVARVLAYRPEIFGNPFSICLEDVMRGPSDWSIGERELFAAFVSRKNQCPF